ncbi:exonuclease domain-containing protein [Hasllibacter sp. MH4015]|uniref:3'-5' exonuclease n=1 Tax=Hasllibacter sp. MH4015 TaxID=2854029 RepID=UPI001CD295E9|nr:exonuclease domain-containing protein [Hasllibacter sp. MH4015]
MFQHLSLRLRIFLFFAFLAVATSGLAIAGLILGYVRLGEDHALSAFVIAGLIGVFAIFGLTAWVWTMFDENVAKPVERLAAEMRARVHAGVDRDLDERAAQHLGDLGPAAAAVTQNLNETRNAMAMAVARETARMTTEKARLEALLSEMPDGVLFCTPDHKLALYNGQARDVLGASDALGLGRPLSALLRMAPVEMAYDRLAEEAEDVGTDILVTTRAGARLLEARMRLLRLEGQETTRPGYVLALRDVSGDLPVLAERAHLLEEAIANLKEAGREDLARDISERKAATDTKWWPMEALRASDLGAALSARLTRKGVALDCDLGTQRLRCDGFAITRLLERLALDWTNAGAADLCLTFARETPDAAVLSLEATGDAPDGWEVWLTTPLSPGLSGFAGRDVLICHGATLTMEPAGDGRAAFRFGLPMAEPGVRGPMREVLYDFDLLHTPLSASLAEAPLSALSYVVFDTETTGLNPAVDEVCQIAAVRIVNGKMRAEERFDMLVNPGRPIPAASTAVHHITDDMVADAVPVGEALARFHTFAEGAVLVAHNAPFDMAFLRRREAEIGARFDQPILDTVLCSAILFGQSADHTLDALCDRLGVTIPEAERHTALGDAIGTADAMARMIPMLKAVEIGSLSTLIRTFDQHKRLIEHLN